MRRLNFFLCLLLVCSGCAQQSNQQLKQQLKQQSKSQSKSLTQDPECNPAPIRYFYHEQAAKALSEQFNGIDQAVAIRIDNELHVALQVSNFDRLRLQSLRKKVSQKLKASFPEDHIHVTTDSKLYNELEKLNKKAWTNEKKSACKQKKKLKDIEKQMRG